MFKVLFIFVLLSCSRDNPQVGVGLSSLNPSVIPYMQLWYDGSNVASLFTDASCSGTNPSDGEDVLCIKDLSGKDNNLVAPTTQEGVYSAASNAIVFNNTDKSFYETQVSATSFDFSATGSNEYTAVVVASYTGATVFSYLLSTTDTNLSNNSGFALSTRNTLNNLEFRSRTTNANWNGQTYDTTSIGGWGDTFIMMDAVKFGASPSRLWSVNGDESSAPIAAPHQASSNQLYIGRRKDVGNSWVGNINEVLIFNKALDTEEREYIQGYLACKWKIRSKLPASHPYYSTDDNDILGCYE